MGRVRRREFWIDFKNDNPDVDVTFEFGASDADILAKMMAGDQADVFHPYTGWLQFYVEEGLVEELDTSNLTNWDKVPERFKELGQFDGKQYFVPYDWGYSSILYRTDLAPEAGDSWAALFDPTYSGHISMWDDGVAAVDVASHVLGLGRAESDRGASGADQAGLDRPARAQPLLLERRAGAGRGHGLR